MPAEFERQQAIMITCCELPDVFVNFVKHTHGQVTIIALFNDVNEYYEFRTLLRERHVPHDHVQFVEAAHDTMWIRDYGPIVVCRGADETLFVDNTYESLDRWDDELVPTVMGERFHVPVVRADTLRLKGGNLLTNGEGLFIATEELILDNADIDLTGDFVRESLEHLYGATETIFLEMLAGEPTGHVDMFATFTSPDTVVVGQCDPRVDWENSEILDRNAERLAAATTSHSPLRVVRIPMPPHDDGVWRTFTNVVYANNILLMPAYPGVGCRQRRQALAVFQKLLPGREIIGVDSEELAELGGGLHCVTVNLGPAGTLANASPSGSPLSVDPRMCERWNRRATEQAK
jgi:agmatine deiminase